MYKNDKASKDDIVKVEKKIRELTEINTRYLKEKKNLEMTNEYLEKEIESKKNQIVKYMKNISDSTKPKTDKGITFANKKANLYVMEEHILKLFNSIQKNSNATLQEKYKSHVEYLYNLEKEMKVSYILIKKLDIKEDFLRSHKLAESNSLFENLKNLSKIGRLNYYNLKPCGPVLMFRVNMSSTFDEIRRKSCDIWSINASTYSLYDDSFNNLECCMDSNINDFFASYQPLDSTLEQGQVCFYLIEKLKNQRELLESQEKAIDSKSDVSNDNSNKANNLAGNDLDTCIELIKNQKILKGINNYKSQKIDIEKRYVDTAKMIDNNIICILINIVLLIVSLYAVSTKKDVFSWSLSNMQNKVFLNSYPNIQLNSMYDVVNYLINYVDPQSQYNIVSNETNFVYYGPIQFRFLQMKDTDCFSSFAGNNVFLNFVNEKVFKCYYKDHMSGTWLTTPIDGYSFQYASQTNITHTWQTSVGYIDTAGIIIRTWAQDGEAFNNTLNKIYQIGNKTNEYLSQNVQGVELTFTFYEPNLDVFISTLILVQLDINQIPQITVADSVPFITDIYEGSQGTSIRTADVIRIILLLVLCLTIPFRIYQKYSVFEADKRGLFSLFKLIVVVFFQVKNIMLVFATGFMLAAYMNFSNDYIPSASYYNARYFIDIYNFSVQQKNARALDELSMYIITLYSLKYLQYIESVQLLFISFKKAAFEYFSLLATICVLFIGLSILTNFIFGSYIYEYKSFLGSIIMNIKIFIFIENTSVTEQFLDNYRAFSIIILIVFIFLIRYFLLNLFYPILIEYYRIEVDKYNLSLILAQNEGDSERLGFMSKLGIFLWPFQKDKRKKKVEGMVKDFDNDPQP